MYKTKKKGYELVGKVVRSSIILAINTDINSPPVGMGEEANLEGCVYTTIFGRRDLFSIWGLPYYSWDQRNYYTS